MTKRLALLATIAALPTLAGCATPHPYPQAEPLPRNVAPPVRTCASTPETALLIVRCKENPPAAAQ